MSHRQFLSGGLLNSLILLSFAAGSPLADPVRAAAQAGTLPIVTAVSRISTQKMQTIVISGRGFGTHLPYNGDLDYIQLSDITRNWNAGHPGNLVNLIVAEWTDSRILLQGFSGSYGGDWSLAPGDVVLVEVWNAQSGAGPATLSTTVAASAPVAAPSAASAAAPVISGVSRISARQRQVVVILGHRFGTMAPYNGDSNFIQLSDITRNWNSGHNGNLVNLIVAEWTDTKIVLQGFSGSYGAGWSRAPGDVVLVQVWNAQSGAGPASYRTVTRPF